MTQPALYLIAWWWWCCAILSLLIVHIHPLNAATKAHRYSTTTTTSSSNSSNSSNTTTSSVTIPLIRVGLDAIVLENNPTVLQHAKKVFQFVHLHPFIGPDKLGK